MSRFFLLSPDLFRIDTHTYRDAGQLLFYPPQLFHTAYILEYTGFLFIGDVTFHIRWEAALSKVCIKSAKVERNEMKIKWIHRLFRKYSLLWFVMNRSYWSSTAHMDSDAPQSSAKMNFFLFRAKYSHLPGSSLASLGNYLLSATGLTELFVIRLNNVVLKVSLGLRTQHQQCLLIPLGANLWRQWDLLFSIHGQNYVLTHTHTAWQHTQTETYANTQTFIWPNTEYSQAVVNIWLCATLHLCVWGCGEVSGQWG